MPVLKFIDAPGSIGFFILCVVLGVAAIYAWPRKRRLGQIWLAAVSAGYLVLGTPAVANTIVRLLPPVRPDDRGDSRKIDILVVFDGDNRRGRVLLTTSAFVSDAPEKVVVLGEEWVVTALIEAGIPAARIEQDTIPTTTREQMVSLAALCDRAPHARIAVIASRLQAPRVDALIRAARLPVTLLSSPVDEEPATEGLARFVPRYIALRVSRDAIYEHAALAYYRWRGWIA